ncbi:MAG TPA: hypothetical protein VMQ76_04815 [Terracidiphilus sp.]|jgi:hypothetical protein|nr:hypothetical protein [Terracidiphilus sp.]
MTAVEILFRYAVPPSDAVTFALASTGEVYGIRRLNFDRAARTLRVEYDATRLNAAAVKQLVCQAGLEVVEGLPAVPVEAARQQAPAA